MQIAKLDKGEYLTQEKGAIHLIIIFYFLKVRPS
jgi:hypothetical protein